MHLRDPDPLGDLALAELLVEAQPDDLLLAWWEATHQLLDHVEIGDVPEPGILLADLSGALAVVARRRVEARRRVGRASGEPFDHLVHGKAEVLGQLRHGR